MRLKRLELQGFKSFLDRTILTFEPGITGVVGPNGCGKSNIVDAIQWVMGEQSAKHLRGDSMTDVIFNGSDTKAPTSMAEVSLVLDRQGTTLSPAFAVFDKSDEIAVTRRVYRDGTGEYLINKVSCRLKDIHELFMDTGVGKRAYSIIEQGQIDRMINVKPEERRHLFEEVSGITKYKAKRKEAERKLEATRANMQRLQDIIIELEKQIRSLKVQATRAKKYKELKSELETVDLHLLGRNLFTHKNQIETLTLTKNDLVNQRSESDALFAEVDSELTSAEVLRIDQEKSYQSLSEKERDLSLGSQKLENQINLLEERKSFLSQTVEENLQEQERLREEISILTAQEQTEVQEREAVAEGMVQIGEGIQAREQEIRLIQEEKQRATHKRDILNHRKTQSSHRLVTLESQIQNFEAKELDFNERKIQFANRQSEIQTGIESHREVWGQVESKISDCLARANQAEREVSVLSADLETSSSRLSELEKILYDSRESYHTQKSRLDSLKELQQNLEGYSPTAREILSQLEGTGIEAVPLAEVLKPSKEIEDHLETLLGADMNTLVVSTADEAKHLANLITEKNLERVKILALSDLEPNSSMVSPPTEGVPLLNLIEVTPGYEGVARWSLGDCFMVSEADRLFALRSHHKNITLLNQTNKTISHDDCSISSGNMPTRTGVFARRREIDELINVATGLEQEVVQLEQERESLLQHLQTQEKMHSELKDKLSSIHIESVEHRKEKEKIQVELGRSERDLVFLDQEIQRNETQIQDVIRLKVEAQIEVERLNQEAQENLVELDAVEAQLANANATLEAAIQEINDKKVEHSRLTERVNSIQFQIETTQEEIENNSRRLTQLEDNYRTSEFELKQMDENVAEVREQLADSERRKNEVLVLLSDTKQAFNETCTKLQELRDKKTELQKVRETVLQEIQELELKISQEQSNYEHLCGISIERYQREPVPFDESVQIDIEKLPLFQEQLNLNWALLLENEKKSLLEEYLKNIREKVSRYGEVNLTAINEFDEVQKRYDFLMTQKTDLESSITILEEAIKKIDETTLVRFSETFEAVNTKFKEIFPILFNGGKAELSLIQTEIPGQDAGVDILVQPPGKSLKSITLLSGGEKALTAVSLILAIFARKPSPFCLLDEVDAPLDDANVSRFNTVIKKMAEKTQFIMVTHNKKTMEIAEALYGVTMERAGISKMTSVRLN
ncbi:MAG: chromosome segregation protein SMC [Deltaproteobacteria bacterium]|nr:chromosome segregation protein SMC [Deltaproteobacteria bacterium]